MKKTPEEPMPSLAEIEAEVMAEGREWTRQRLEARLQALADQHGEVFPPKPGATGSPAQVSVWAKHRGRLG